MQASRDDAVTNDMQDSSNYKKPKITPKPKRGRKPKFEPVVAEGQEENEEQFEEYEIEKIVGHRLYKDTVVKYEIKWKGYNEKDNTLESAKSIHIDVPDLCAAYWDLSGHVPRPLNAPASKNNKRKKIEVEKDVSLKKRKGILEHVPQYMLERGYSYPTTWPNSKTKWEHDMKKFGAIQLSPVDKSIKLAYIEWNTGDKTIHTLEECHQKCPLQLIHYYEERLRFV
ncbi:hypothetical protein BDF21DRAFT_423837 [Thamnidium elegans]|nr:hypothetical protein BDF21DRAFT_423837 [Thamnidium elegans]